MEARQESQPEQFSKFHFGDFEVDTRERELRRNGLRIPLQDQPFRVLLVLLEHPGQIVTREQLREQIWPADTFVEFEHSLNTAVNKLRASLRDSAEEQRYIATIPRRGYRFVGVLRTAAGTPPIDAPPRSSRRSLWVGLAVSLSLAVVLIAALATRFSAPASQRTFRTALLTSFPGAEGHPSFSPDGNQIAFLWDGPNQDNVDIYVKTVAVGEPLRLTNAPDIDDVPAWSPDGRWIAFVRRQPAALHGDVFVISPLGGSERKVGVTVFPDLKTGPTLAWTPDSRWLAVRDSGRQPAGLYLLALDGQQARLLLPSPAGAVDLDASFSSDGKFLAFSRAGAIHVAALDGLSVHGEPRRLSIPGNTSERWPVWGAGLTEIIFVRRSGVDLFSLWRVPANGTGEPVRIPNISSSMALEPAIPREGGRLAFSERTLDSNIWRVKLTDRRALASPPSMVMASSRFDGTMALSPDSTRVAFTSTRSGSEEIWIATSDGSHPRQLTHYAGGMVGSAKWSPDGKFIVYDAFLNGNRDIYVMRSEGGVPLRLTEYSNDDNVPSWSADGRWIYFSSDKGGRRVIWKKAFPGGEETQVTKDGGLAARESPDGKFFCYFAENPQGLWAMPMADGVPELQRKRLVAESASIHVYDVSNRGIYFAGFRPGYPNLFPRFGPLFFYNFADGRIHKVLEIPSLSLGLSVSSDERTLLFSQVDSAHADLMLIEPFL